MRTDQLTAIRLLAVPIVAFTLIPANGGASPDPAMPDTLSFDSASLTFDEQFQNGEFEACIDTGKWLLTALADIPGASPLARGQILAKLATAQQRAGRVEAALQNYEAALSIIETQTDKLDSRLEGPLWEFARLLDRAGETADAALQYERALHLHSVNYGVQDPGLADYLHEVSEFYFRLGDFAQARSLQRYRVDLLRREYGIDSLEILPALYDHADMLERSGALLDAQAEYRDIMRRIVRADGRRSHLMIPVVGKLANLFLYNEMYDGYDGVKQARRYYYVMMDLTERNEEATTAQKVEAFTGMGDYYTLKTNNAVKAGQYYRKAWLAMSADPDARLQIDDMFGSTTVLNDIPSVHSSQFTYWRDRVQRRGMKKGIVVVRYDVGTDGRMTNVRIARSEPERFKDFLVVKQLSRFVYRPAIRNGELVESRDLEYRFEYAYWDDEYRDFLDRGISNIAVAPTVAANRDDQ